MVFCRTNNNLHFKCFKKKNKLNILYNKQYSSITFIVNTHTKIITECQISNKGTKNKKYTYKCIKKFCYNKSYYYR